MTVEIGCIAEIVRNGIRIRRMHSDTELQIRFAEQFSARDNDGFPPRHMDAVLSGKQELHPQLLLKKRRYGFHCSDGVTGSFLSSGAAFIKSGKNQVRSNRFTKILPLLHGGQFDSVGTGKHSIAEVNTRFHGTVFPFPDNFQFRSGAFPDALLQQLCTFHQIARGKVRR